MQVKRHKRPRTRRLPAIPFLLLLVLLLGALIFEASASEPPQPTGVSLDMHEINVDNNAEQQTLTATIAPEGAMAVTLVWETDDPGVASVVGNNDNTATVTINGVGSATITVTIQGTAYCDTCSVTVSEYVCSHENKTEVPAKTASCTEDGNFRYYHCNDCNIYIITTNAGEITSDSADDAVIPALGHNYDNVAYSSDGTQHWRVCARCNEDEAKVNHTFGDAGYHWSNDHSTCEATHSCTVCGKVVSETVDSTSRVTAQVTCTTPELTVYTATFTKGFDAVDSDPVETRPAGHDWGAPTYTWSGDYAKCTAIRICTRDASHKEEETAETTTMTTADCVTPGNTTYTATFTNAGFEQRTETVAVDALGHAYQDIPAKAATCTEAGNIAYKICSRCGDIVADGDYIIPALGHDLTGHTAKAATKTSSGNLEYWSCSRCGKYFSDSQGNVEIERSDWFLPATGNYLPSALQVTGHGTVTSAPQEPELGDVVTLTAVPDAGHKLLELQVVDAGGQTVELTPGENGTWKFVQPLRKVTIQVRFGPDPVRLFAPFPDLDPDAWYAEGVAYVLSEGIMVGDGTYFHPGRVASRAEIVQILFNLSGAKAGSEVAAFGDVAAGDWYAAAVTWAFENGIARGEGDLFGAKESISREKLAVLLYNYAKYLGLEVTAAGDLSQFGDADSVSDDAREAMSWAVGVGLFRGTGYGDLSPLGTVDRAQVAALIQRFCEKVAK